MKSIKAIAAVGVFLLLSPGYLMADCPDISSHACCGGGYTWKTYAFDLTCPTVTSGVGTTTACSMSMHNVANNASTQTVTYQYTIPSTSTGWEIRVDYDFDNGGDTGNFIKAEYTVTRGGSTISSGTVLDRNTSWACGVASAYPLSWTAGDILTVTISLRATNSSSYARAAALTLFKVPA
jgi:hypothetical protein